ncbi:hypothetical protein BJX68DRAFT_261740 [Aspergillus pseudodeflectus]|uniref:Zn(2)-C6 fungal-type domain-containing protein n=1 Tax=Aspergillus pseudodeflectus TaxID=176178 RepID=A0ABR4L448_9EURO
MHVPTASVVTRVRASGKRSRTGCRTCRARHVKCDETPVACHNCTSTGRKCDGYDAQRLPRDRKKGADKTGPALALQADVGRTIGWAMTTDERQCFAYFHGHTIPTLLQFFDSTLWQKHVLQLARYEPAVYHAIVALSAIHRNSATHGMQLATPASIRADDAWHQFAQDQLGRSVALLNQRCTSQDPSLREVILVCCLLFILADLLRGRYDDAFQHLRGGLCILKELQAAGNASNAFALVEESVVAAFGHLDILASHYDRIFPILCPYTQRSFMQHLPCSDRFSVTQFHTLREVRAAFDVMLRKTYRFCSRCLGISQEEISQNYETLQSEQHAVWSEVEEFKQQFEPFYATYYDYLTPKEQRGLDIIKIHLLSIPVGLKSLLLGKNRAALTYYTPELETVCSMVEEIMARFTERPSMTMENGVIPPLFHCANLTPDYSVRWWALELLRSWPHREGPFDSNWIAYLSEEGLRLELEHRCANEPGFRETVFLLRGEELSVDEMIFRLSRSQRRQLHGLRRGGGGEEWSTEAPGRDFLETFAEFENMREWSCVRALMEFCRSSRKTPAECLL